jgi:hypothetical protein
MLWQFRHPSRFLFPLGLLLVLASLSLAQDASEPAMTPHERTLMAESFTTEKCTAWQKRLNLSDWQVSVMVVRTGDLKPKTLGNIHWDTKKKTAVIRVLDPADYKMPLHAMLDDMEFTVVHELIHLQLSPVFGSLQRNDANRLEEEYAVNHMAQALLDLDRAK